MENILSIIANSPVLAFLGALVILALVLIPIILRLAGLTGEQIVQVLIAMQENARATIREFRQQNINGNSDDPPLP